ncbi:MAG: discoidin domain-containing protein, partial [Nitrososphaerales archaeon]
VAGCRILHNSDANYRPQAYKIQGSSDGSTWEDLYTQTTQPQAGWIEHAWNPKPSIRYLRILITSHGASGTRINEFDYYQSSIWRHGHRGD